MKENTLGSYLKKKEKKLGISSRQLAIRCKITPAYVSDIEKDKRIPTKEILERLANELKMNDEEKNIMFDLAVVNYENRVAYDLVDYIMSTPHLRACIRKSKNKYDDTFWKAIYQKLDSGGQEI